MKSQAHSLGAILLALLASLLIAAPARANVPVARTISNIASIAWDAGGQRVELPSNRVDIEITPPADPAVLETLRLPDGTAYSPTLLSGTCSLPQPGARLRARKQRGRSAPFLL